MIKEQGIGRPKRELNLLHNAIILLWIKNKIDVDVFTVNMYNVYNSIIIDQSVVLFQILEYFDHYNYFLLC